MTLRVTCDDLLRWNANNADLTLDTVDKVEGSASVLATVLDGSKYEAIAQYASGPLGAIDLTFEPILRFNLKPSIVTAAIYVQLIIITGDDFDQVNIGTVALSQGVWNVANVDLRTITDPAFDITKWRGFTARYYLSAAGQTPTLGIDAVESLAGLADLNVTGVVTDENTLLPLADVSVDANGYSTITASDGYYALVVAPGRYDITFSKTGYRTKVLTSDVNADIVLNVSLEPLPPQAILTISVFPIGAGITNPAEGSYSYDIGSTVNVDATALQGYVFDHWELDGFVVGSAMPYPVIMDVDHSLRAVFNLIPAQRLTINSTPIQNIQFNLEVL